MLHNVLTADSRWQRKERDAIPQSTAKYMDWDDGTWKVGMYAMKVWFKAILPMVTVAPFGWIAGDSCESSHW